MLEQFYMGLMIRDYLTLQAQIRDYLQAQFDLAHDGATWDRVAWCEERGDWTVVGSSYSGGLGFANSTWDAWGGRQYAPRAGMASRNDQVLVADTHVDSIGQRGLVERTRGDCGGYSGW